MDRTNIFFLIVAGGFAWWIWNDYQKVREKQAALIAAAAAGAPEETLQLIQFSDLPTRRGTV